MSLKTKMMLTFSIVTVVIWAATIGYTFPTVSKLLQLAATQGDYTRLFQSFQRNVLIAGTGGTLFSIFVGYIMARLILGPMQRVMDAMKEVEEGNLTVEVSSNTSCELNVLCRTFNGMVQKFTDYVRKMEEVALEIAAVATNLNEIIGEVTTATDSIATTIQSVAADAENQNATVRDTSTIFQQMSQGVEQVAISAGEVSEASKQAANLSERGSHAIDTAVTQMETISQAVNASAHIVTRLGERSREIGLILDSITNIAEQTNLLALNAAIEAARAGEQGRGFAVVAEEVRKLAEQSAAAAKQITEMIKLVQHETEQAVRSMEHGTSEVKNGIKAVGEAGNSFAEIFEVVKKVNRQIEEVSAASQQMAVGGKQAVSAVGNIALVSEKSAAGAQSVAASTQELASVFHEGANAAGKLAKMSAELMAMVHKMKKE
ncbi:methyl-accepting chemotaxis protein [Zhaonella formicivorans]|uniref:methyl-accepting chemotaxis protein n=1 Tax=Zhaonella formicivorans TaxID=2528593 RepID=UPI0010F42240|nr:HAMP domain-containing methyl-accepting chemotaxis protein [Zhaonella formicivorans]